MSVTPLSRQLVEDLLTAHAGAFVRVTRMEPVYGATVVRCGLDVPIPDLGASVIVKRGRAAGEFRSEATMMRNEIAALGFLTDHTLPFGPRMIAYAAAAGIVVMEDLGDGPSLEDLLFGNDRRAAVDGLIAFGIALGELHAATAGRADAFLAAQGRQSSAQLTWEPVAAFGVGFRSSWLMLRSSVEAHPELPQPAEVEPDINAMLRTLARPSPYLAMTNGDPCPANTRFTSGTLRFLDFEQATFQHALLDLVALHLPFPACPCWSVLPEEATAPAIHAWRTAFATQHPAVLNDDEYFAGAAAACLAWAILRLVPWIRLDAADEPHPVGFTKRAQRIATIDAAVSVARRSGTLPALAEWFAAFSSALKDRWSGTPMMQTVAPAFATARPDLPVGKLPPVPDDQGGIRIRAGAG